MAKPQKSTAQSEVPGLVKKGPLYYLKRDWQLYALMLLPMVFIIVFKYFAYTGLSVAFLDYKIGKGYAGSKFVGLKIFEKVFKHRDFTKAVVNTLLLNVLDLIFSFPMPIILALLLNEIRVKWFKRTTQTLLYLPHFLSWVVIGAVAYQMFATQSGVVNALIANAGKSPIPFLQEDGWWLFSYVLIGVWQTMGWGTIIYLAAITNVNSETAADFLAVLIPGAAGRRPLADAVPVPDSVPVYARRAVGQAVAEGLIAPEALTKPLNRSNAAEICRRLHI